MYRCWFEQWQEEGRERKCALVRLTNISFIFGLLQGILFQLFVSYCCVFFSLPLSLSHAVLINALVDILEWDGNLDRADLPGYILWLIISKGSLKRVQLRWKYKWITLVWIFFLSSHSENKHTFAFLYQFILCRVHEVIMMATIFCAFCEKDILSL